MNLIDAYFMHPVALDHARAVLHVELDMLRNGIGVKKRREWLVAQRNKLCADAVITVPPLVAPILESLTTRDALRIFAHIENNLTAMGAGSTFRSLRNAQRRNGLSENVFDQASINGALIVLSDDAEFCEVFSRLVLGLLENIDRSPAFAAMNDAYARIAERNDLETVKQQRLLQLASESFPQMIDYLNFDVMEERTIAYLRGRLLDQSIMASLAALVRVQGAGIFESSVRDIVDVNITAYRQVIQGILNGRILELSDPVTAATPPDLAERSTPNDHDHVSSATTAAPNIGEPELLSINETADMLRVSRITVQRLLKRGAIESTHVGRRHLVVYSSILKYLSLTNGL